MKTNQCILTGIEKGKSASHEPVILDALDLVYYGRAEILKAAETAFTDHAHFGLFAATDGVVQAFYNARAARRRVAASDFPFIVYDKETIIFSTKREILISRIAVVFNSKSWGKVNDAAVHLNANHTAKYILGYERGGK